MAVANSRNSFKEYCLRRLGKGAIKINVTDDQVDDRVDEALSYFRDYHYVASSRTYLKHQVTAQDITNQYITIADDLITEVYRILPLTGMASTTSMFDIRYQIALNDLYTITQQSMVPFFMTMQHLSLLEQMLQGVPSIEFNRYRNRIDITTNWDKIREGSWLVFEVDRFVDPAEYTEMWGDRWLSRYATALIKYQWGSNLGKINIQLPGGVSYNGLAIAADAKQEIAELEDRMINDFSAPMGVYLG